MVFLSARKGAHIAVSQGPVRVPLPAITFYFFFFPLAPYGGCRRMGHQSRATLEGVDHLVATARMAEKRRAAGMDRAKW